MRRTRRCAALAALGLLCVAAAAMGQVRDPTTLEFTPSTDHDAVTETGAPAVTGYILHLYYADDLVNPWATHDLYKPTPDGATGQIVIPGIAIWLAAPQAERACVATVTAFGPGGESVSAASNTWVTSALPTPAPDPVHDFTLILRGVL